MDAAEREAIVESLSTAFGGAHDVTPGEGQPLHVLLSALELPPPWQPSPARALTIWKDWPAQRPEFVVDDAVVGGGGAPPRSNSPTYLLGETWRSFSFAFSWSGSDPVRAVQLWLTRFVAEQT